MIMTLEDYFDQRYQALEQVFLEKTQGYLEENKNQILNYLVKNTTDILKNALKTQETTAIPCGYLSFSLLLTSVMENKPKLQVDLYNGEWVYGEPWERGKIDAEFLFKYWEELKSAALDDAYFVRSRISSAMIKTFFYDTLDELTYLFAVYMKKYGENFGKISEFDEMKKERPAYITVGTYFDWQERIFVVNDDENRVVLAEEG